MTWETECTEVVRVLINDLSEPYKYDDCRITRVLKVSATQIVTEIDFPVDYTVNLFLGTITPDPAATDNRDENFLNLLALKTAVLITNGEVREYSLASFRVVDGPSSIDTTARTQNMKLLAAGLESKYEKLKAIYQSGQIGQAVLSPYTVDSIYPYQNF